MDLLTILFIAVGLAMDSFAVSIVNGSVIKRLGFKHALIIGASFGIFQAVMPILGWLVGLGFRDFITSVDHWVAFGLLLFIGGRMILGSFKPKNGKKLEPTLSAVTLFLLSIATSIDALVVGLSFSFIGVDIIFPAVIIGCVTFALSVVGVYIGKRTGKYFEKKIEVVGGIILIIIGVRILIEHLS